MYYFHSFSVDLCKEVVDGLRLMVDFVLPNNLLYEVERLQYEQVCSEQLNQRYFNFILYR